jgi:hypothetical protein
MGMNGKWYYFTPANDLMATESPPPESKSFAMATHWIAPSTLEPLHRSFAAWGAAHRSPGLVTPERIWLTTMGTVAFHFERNAQPAPQSTVGAHAGMAAWLVLLAKYTEMSAVIESAGKVWSINDLAGALAFTTPALLPQNVLTLSPNNWESVARALAADITQNRAEQLQESPTVTAN